MASPEPNPSSPPGLWTRLWARPKARWLLGIPLGGMLMLGLGALALGSVNWGVEQASTTQFCFTCHSHQQFIRPEYEASSHFRNAVGVRAACADCHLPHGNWFATMYTHVLVSTDVIYETAGEISTREKFERHRGEMAQKVWAQMLGNQSAFCRKCHSFQAMDLTAQGGMPARSHAKAMQSGKTCIECHRGIVHTLPQNADELWGQVVARAKH